MSAILICSMMWLAPLFAQSGGLQFPAESGLESGDLLWPKKPGAIIPYASRPGAADDSDRATWELEVREHIEHLRKSESLTEDERARYEILRGMSYEEFLAVYLNDEEPGRIVAFGGALGVGHVAVVRIRDGAVTVVEAMMGIGVREVPYAKWKEERKGSAIWHGRLASAPLEDRSKIAEYAAVQVGKPYRFWNFNLEDDSGFYCSKLVWLAIRQATGVVVDDKPQPRRTLWFSPKQLLRSRHLVMLQNPGKYATK